MGKFYDNTDIDSEKLKEVVKKIDDKKPTDINTIPVKLLSKGKTGLPTEILIKNFRNKDLLNFSIANEDDSLEESIQLIQGAIVDNEIDANDLTYEELSHLLLVIYSNFWSSTVTLEYPLEQSEIDYLKESQKDLYDRYMKKEHVFTLDIPISKFNADFLDDNFKEPIKIKKDDIEAHFILPRVKHILIAQNYTIKQMDDTEKASLIKKVNSDELLPSQKIEALKLIKEMSFISSELIKIQTLTYLKTNTEEFKNVTLEDQLKIENEDLIPVDIWMYYTDYIKKMKYGLDLNIKVKSPITSKKVTRRFEFRLNEVISQLKIPKDNGISISFG